MKINGNILKLVFYNFLMTFYICTVLGKLKQICRSQWKAFEDVFFSCPLAIDQTLTADTQMRPHPE